MFKTISILVLSSIFSIGSAFAAQSADSRIRRYPYNENTVYRLDLHLKSVTALQFADSEEVQAILIGDSASWEVVKLKSGNVVSIKPIVASAATNMTIYTDRRVYTFELNSAGEAASGGPNNFRSVFTYPAEPKEKDETALNADPLNFDYMVSGQAAFRPKFVQDNGKQTTFFLPKNSPRPAIFRVGADKKEELVNSRTNGDQVIVDGTNNFWVLRIGDQLVCIGREPAVRKTGHSIETAEAGHGK